MPVYNIGKRLNKFLDVALTYVYEIIDNLKCLQPLVELKPIYNGNLPLYDSVFNELGKLQDAINVYINNLRKDEFDMKTFDKNLKLNFAIINAESRAIDVYNSIPRFDNSWCEVNNAFLLDERNLKRSLKCLRHRIRKYEIDPEFTIWYEDKDVREYLEENKHNIIDYSYWMGYRNGSENYLFYNVVNDKFYFTYNRNLSWYVIFDHQLLFYKGYMVYHDKSTNKSMVINGILNFNDDMYWYNGKVEDYTGDLDHKFILQFIDNTDNRLYFIDAYGIIHDSD